MGRILLLAILAIGCTAPLPAPQRTIDEFFTQFTDEWVRGNPNLAASTRYFTGAQQDQLERQLTPVTEEYRRQRISLAKNGLTQLRSFDRKRLTEAQRVSAEVLEWQLDIVVREEPYLDFEFPLEQNGGVNVSLPNTLTVTHAITRERDAENYVARLEQVAPRMEEAITQAGRLATKNMIPPKFILTATITQMKNFVAPTPAQNPFVTAFVEKMNAVKDLPETRRSQLRAQAEKIVSEQIYGAWNRAIAFLESLQPKATEEAGISRFKDGAAAYAYALRRYTSTNLTADQIHQTGLRQVEKIEKEMDALFRKLGRTQGTVKERIEQLKKDQAYPLTEDGRKQIMDEVNRILMDAQNRSAALFDRVPKAPVVAQPYPRFREANAAASYNTPAQDGSRPGTFQIPLRPERMTKFGLRTLVYHETVPGHHFQLALQTEDQSLPRFRQIGAYGIISALNEGWGLYAERLAAESGWYEGDVEGLLGQLDAELFRARRLVVDTGLHTKHWTRQQAIDYGIEASEVERYVMRPGQACAYMLGELKLIELRDKAKKALGSKFSFYEFHNAVLKTGTAPLDIVESQVNAYIRAAGGKV